MLIETCFSSSCGIRVSFEAESGAAWALGLVHIAEGGK